MESAGVSLGAISGTFGDLKKRGFLIDSDRHRGRRLPDLKRLFEDWVINYPVVLRPKLNPRRFSSPNPNWWQNEQLDKYGAVWGGEVAAERITQYLKPAAQTLYVAPSAMSSCLSHLISKHRLRPDPHGQIEILDKFWNFSLALQGDIAPTILVYADLVATLEPRNSEVAKMIRERLIDPTFHQSQISNDPRMLEILRAVAEEAALAGIEYMVVGAIAPSHTSHSCFWQSISTCDSRYRPHRDPGRLPAFRHRRTAHQSKRLPVGG